MKTGSHTRHPTRLVTPPTCTYTVCPEDGGERVCSPSSVPQAADRQVSCVAACPRPELAGPDPKARAPHGCQQVAAVAWLFVFQGQGEHRALCKAVSAELTCDVVPQERVFLRVPKQNPAVTWYMEGRADLPL